MDNEKRVFLITAAAVVVSGCASIALVGAAGGSFYRCEIDEIIPLPFSRKMLKCENGRIELEEIKKMVLLETLNSADIARAAGAKVKNDRIIRNYKRQLQITIAALEQKNLKLIP